MALRSIFSRRLHVQTSGRINARLFSAQKHMRRLQSTEAGNNAEKPADAPPPVKKGGVGKAITIGAVGAALIGGGLAYFLQGSMTQKEIEEHNKAISNQGLPARKRLAKTSMLTTALVNNQTSKLASCHGVSEILTCWLNANDPFEDRHSEHLLGDHGVLVGVYDGHSGFRVSDALSIFLPTYVQRELEASKPKSTIETADALTKALLAFDNDLTDAVPRAAMETKNPDLMRAFTEPAFNGAVGVVALINSTGIYIANTGDCRAVMGIERADGEMGAVQMSLDQTGDTPSEVARIRNEHPGEDHCVFRGRVLGGLQPSRAFGDSRYKWDASRLEAAGVRKPRYSQTPPYVTAKPEIQHATLDASAKFVILATDGLWDVVPSTEAVQIVAKALRQGTGSMPAAAELVRHAIERYAHESTHDDVEALLSISPPQARNYRDDITCSVILLEPEVVTGETAAPGADPTMPSVVCNLDKPMPHTLMEIFENQKQMRMRQPQSPPSTPPSSPPPASSAPAQQQPPAQPQTSQ
eukprot:m.28961 g.28961  ORF g.28961 m.28961 type:complete len:526 (-) comp10490_c0_seq1:270-1847(-)